MACGYDDTYILLYRKLLHNGHFSLPHIAFKIFIYLLLKANRFPDTKWKLGIGECWVSYSDIQTDCAEGDGNVLSKATVAKMLNLLEHGGYIRRIVTEGVGMKVKVKNYGAYQLKDTSSFSEPVGINDQLTSSFNEPPTSLVTSSLNEPLHAEKNLQSLEESVSDASSTYVGCSSTGSPTSSLTGSPSEHIQESNKESKRIKKHTVMDHYHDLFFEKFEEKPFINGGKDGALLKKVINTYGEEKTRSLLTTFFNSEDKFIRDSGYSIGAFISQINKLVIAAREVENCGKNQQHHNPGRVAGKSKTSNQNFLPFGVRCAGEDD
ncbi:hypothetical protein EV210_101215 [Anaerospora hongkongensis]|uniref:Uncharacterized protein n=1 Tax=Anaerospora hongkongensis TaxID=244830 RepID=A0A4R1QAR6_9FIRM|nr:hypothetical protein [Anaerospora hongkongensis]TCL40015.1 hypothetical protein EV210_101215 [Anaerospora hongkongensis]